MECFCGAGWAVIITHHMIFYGATVRLTYEIGGGIQIPLRVAAGFAGADPR
jgi:hypothetical protein